MLPAFKTFLAQQAKKPSGWFGRTVATGVFNKENKAMEQFGLELMAPQEHDRILEIGFGNGRLISEMIPRVPKGKVAGIDVSDEMVNLASSRNIQWIEKGLLDIQKASVEKIPYQDEAFDKIFTANTLYFWPEPEKNLREIKRVLKQGGQFYCALRLREQMENRNSKFQSSVVRNNRKIFANLYHIEEVKMLFDTAGFRDVELKVKNNNSEKLYIISAIK